jgi:phospholipid/cholesterol/gamma-HCH transport system permease protein
LALQSPFPWFRDLVPVLTAVMLIGRAGSSISAEIGILRISEQIDALETMKLIQSVI